jgi:hypothetical protein
VEAVTEREEVSAKVAVLVTFENETGPTALLECHG